MKALPTLPHIVLFGAILLVLQIPQLLVWRALYGAWLTVPMGGSFIRLDAPALLPILFSPRNGLLSWTPLVLLALVGLVAFVRLNARLALGLAVAFLAQWYLNATIADWWGGSAFGGRRFIGSSLVFIVGLAALVQQAGRRWLPRLALFALLFAGVGWNLLLWTQYALGTAPVQASTDLRQIYVGQFQYGLENVYRLLGRSTWLDLAIRSGVLEQNWENVAAALAWLISLVAVVLAASGLWSRLSRRRGAGAI